VVIPAVAGKRTDVTGPKEDLRVEFRSSRASTAKAMVDGLSARKSAFAGDTEFEFDVMARVYKRSFKVAS
jgi:hypothetical protein